MLFSSISDSHTAEQGSTDCLFSGYLHEVTISIREHGGWHDWLRVEFENVRDRKLLVNHITAKPGLKNNDLFQIFALIGVRQQATERWEPSKSKGIRADVRPAAGLVELRSRMRAAGGAARPVRQTWGRYPSSQVTEWIVRRTDPTTETAYELLTMSMCSMHQEELGGSGCDLVDRIGLQERAVFTD